MSLQIFRNIVESGSTRKFENFVKKMVVIFLQILPKYSQKWVYQEIWKLCKENGRYF
jgi:hypothetical protein